MAQVIVVGGGLGGMSAAHTLLQHGANVIVIDKSPFCGGNSTKATSGINAGGTSTQRKLKIPDSPEVFEADTTASAEGLARPALIRALTHESAPAVEWLKDSFGLDLSIVARLAAHSFPRTHRGPEQFPGMAITFGLMEKLDEIVAKGDGRARVLNKAKVTKLLRDASGAINGVEYVKDGETFTEMGPVVIATGGFGADFEKDSLLASVQEQWRTLGAWQKTSRAGKQNNGINCVPPQLLTLPTTNGPHCSGDGIKLSLGVGADTLDLHYVQVHPTGLVDPSEPNAKVKFLAAEALRGSGGIIIDGEGNRFADELGKRDYVTGRMWFHNKPPYRLLLNSKATAKIAWHCEHYSARGLMKHMTGADLAKEVGVPVTKLKATFDEFNRASQNPNGPDNKWGVKYFEAVPYETNDKFMVSIITPVIHYCMGGVAANEKSEVLTPAGKPIAGLFVCGEAQGGVHGENRLGGSSLLDCVVYGRIAGRSAAKYLLETLTVGGASGAGSSVSNGNVSATLNVAPGTNKVTLELTVGGASAASSGASKAKTAAESAAAKMVGKEIDPNAAFYGQGVGSKKGAAAPAAGGGGMKTFSAADVLKHNTDKDCWVVLHNGVYDVTKFLPDHPGGKKAIMLYAGKDATKEFDMLHKKEIIDKYAKEYQVGVLEGAAKL